VNELLGIARMNEERKGGTSGAMQAKRKPKKGGSEEATEKLRNNPV
jgi:hypothetical protein